MVAALREVQSRDPNDSYTTSNGYSVAIVTRDGKFLARGRYQGHQFGVTLGDDSETAAQRLRRLLVELEDNTFVAGREAKKRQLARTQVPNCDLRSLADSFLCDVRRRRGKKTATDYRNRLAHMLDFAETPDSRRRWPKAKDIDREFALQARVFLQNRDVRRNGKPGGPEKKMSQGQVRNCLETLNLALTWASRADVRQLPPNYRSPVTLEIIGPKPTKNPLRGVELPIATRIKLVSRMDEWQGRTTHFVNWIRRRFAWSVCSFWCRWLGECGGARSCRGGRCRRVGRLGVAARLRRRTRSRIFRCL